MMITSPFTDSTQRVQSQSTNFNSLNHTHTLQFLPHQNEQTTHHHSDTHTNGREESTTNDIKRNQTVMPETKN